MKTPKVPTPPPAPLPPTQADARRSVSDSRVAPTAPSLVQPVTPANKSKRSLLGGAS